MHDEELPDDRASGAQNGHVRIVGWAPEVGHEGRDPCAADTGRHVGFPGRLGGRARSCATTTCTLLAEQLLHGWDIAQTIRVPWDIGLGDARLVIAGVAPIFELRNRDGRAEVEVEYELAVEGGPHLFALFRHGKLGISTSPSGAVDCRLGGDPVTWLLALYGRAPWNDLLDSGKITVDGGDAELAVEFKRLLRNP